MSTAPLLRSSSIERSDKICYEPSPEIGGDEQDYLIFHIPGNPGLIPYYQPFLSKLHNLLVTSSSAASARFHICGHSLKGFEFTKNGLPPQSPLGLSAQIEYQEDLLYNHVKSHRERTGNTPKVILMGHSVGAYILLELIRHHEKKIHDSQDEDFDLIGGILLFPTITHIAKSRLGTVASVRTFGPYSECTIAKSCTDRKFSISHIFQWSWVHSPGPCHSWCPRSYSISWSSWQPNFQTTRLRRRSLSLRVRWV